jgi:hypothetical protein
MNPLRDEIGLIEMDFMVTFGGHSVLSSARHGRQLCLAAIQLSQRLSDLPFSSACQRSRTPALRWSQTVAESRNAENGVGDELPILREGSGELKSRYVEMGNIMAEYVTPRT